MRIAVRGISLAAALVLLSASAATAALPPGWKVCANRLRGYAIGYPGGWYTAQLRASERCSAFDPQPFRVEPGTERPLTRLQVSIEAASAVRVAGWFTDRRFTHGRYAPTRVNGRGGYRFEAVANNQGIFPAGTRFYGYVLDRGGRAFVVQTAVPPQRSGYASFKTVVDRAVASVRFFSPHRTTQAAGRRAVRVYFSNPRLQRDPTSCSEVFARRRSVPTFRSREQTLTAALRSLLRGPSHAERARGYRSWFSTRTADSLRGVRILPAGLVRIDFADLSGLIHNAGSSCGSASLLAALTTTVRDLLPRARPVYSLDGSCRAFSDWLQQVPPRTCPPTRQ
ncbi:Sporulation and spore germination [Gaiella occulta]|uniref:Sporulation and spore germination n=1 Tax=Gaiella occulta TaxID=1002870 RepID=A0A7M2YUU7_9ACTN|nr:GerMN domain-containing protein [Gaiella occulta]RDI73389.1 Sporulation and spore germination [Gaiella occulta]